MGAQNEQHRAETADTHNQVDSGSDRLNLIETIVVFAISCAVIIFVFSISAAGLGNYRFRLPDFLTDSVKTVWSLLTAGGVAIAGSALDLALRRHPRRVNYLVYIIVTTGILFIPIVGLLWFGKDTQNSAWSPPQGATNLDIPGQAFSNRSFTLSPLPGPAIAMMYISGTVSFDGKLLTGTASGRIAKPSIPVTPPPPPAIATTLAIHLCYYKPIPGNAFPAIVLAPPFPQSNNSGSVTVSVPMTEDAIDIPKFDFSIEVPDIGNSGAAWLCAILSTNSRQSMSISN